MNSEIHIKDKVKNKSKSIFTKIVFSRTMVTLLLLLFQLFILFASFAWFSRYTHYIYGGFAVISAIVIVFIVNTEGKAEFKIAWLIPVCIIPIFGSLLYIFLTLNIGYWNLRKRNLRRVNDTEKYLTQNKAVVEDISKLSVHDAQLASYIYNTSKFPIYRNPEITYFPLGEYKFKDMLEELKKAEKFIFLEYFIVEHGIMWDSILDILIEKARQGVEVRFMYDGTCTLLLLPHGYPKQLEKYGIETKVFAPIKPLLTTDQNNRDHRKLLVIDGKVAYNGGINLADEYINEIVKYGHWKDIAIKVKGEAVKSYTAMFLQMWYTNVSGECEYDKYLNIESHNAIHDDGYIIPYADGPVLNESVAETVYLDMLNTATKYVHIMTPYLIIDNDMVEALTFAARRGIDVKLILPHISDKKSAFAIARTFYPHLIAEGVKIYEYTPGFVHAKLFVADDVKAVVGTINLDYRSLYHHFECGTYFYHNKIIQTIEDDFNDTIDKCHLVTIEDYFTSNLFRRIEGRIFRIFGPLM